jgi:hypothetical protein
MAAMHVREEGPEGSEDTALGEHGCIGRTAASCCACIASSCELSLSRGVSMVATSAACSNFSLSDVSEHAYHDDGVAEPCRAPPESAFNGLKRAYDALKSRDSPKSNSSLVSSRCRSIASDDMRVCSPPPPPPPLAV